MIILKILKYTGIVFLAMIMMAPVAGIILLVAALAIPTPPVSKGNMNYYFKVHLPTYTVDSIRRRESFTHDVSEWQKLQFDSLKQEEWLSFISELRNAAKDTIRAKYQIRRLSKCKIPKLGPIKGGYKLEYSYMNDSLFGGEEVTLAIDTVLYTGYLYYFSY